MTKLLVVLFLLVVAFGVVSCNMMRGAGEDIEDAGDAVKDATN